MTSRMRATPDRPPRGPDAAGLVELACLLVLAGTPPGLSAAETMVPFPDQPVMVNQVGYDAERPKRFTAPLLQQGTFVLTASDAEAVLYRGTVEEGVGDFSAFRPAGPERAYVITVSGTGRPSGRSDPFRIAPFRFELACLDPALRFWVDDRSVTGSLRSAFGGSPWRDCPCYAFDTPSLVLLYLADPAFFEQAPVEMAWAMDRARVLDPGFSLEILRADFTRDENALEIARRYYREVDPPVGERVPDIIQCIHWGVGWWRLKPVSYDHSNDPEGEIIHSQTIAAFAFFLHAYPAMRRYFTPRFYADIRDFTVARWRTAGLFAVDRTIGDFKGRACPGFSILPNLLMHEVATRDGLPDAEAYLQAAVAEAAWVVDGLDFEDPRTTKGQRMSEHRLMLGLALLQRWHPGRAPAGLLRKLEAWAGIMIRRSGNCWDFRRYDDRFWTLPRHESAGHDRTDGGAGWNEPGNLAGFPAAALAVAELLPDRARARRLEEIATAQFDALFGRNPVGAGSPSSRWQDFPGLRRGWPAVFAPRVCAGLETVRGTLASSASGEQYPYAPDAPFRHPEGWSAHNAAFNVGLAVACRAGTSLELADPASGRAVGCVVYGRPLLLRLRAALGAHAHPVVQVRSGDGGERELALQLTPGTAWEATTGVAVVADGPGGAGTLVVPRGGTLALSYGLGCMQRTASWPCGDAADGGR